MHTLEGFTLWPWSAWSPATRRRFNATRRTTDGVCANTCRTLLTKHVLPTLRSPAECCRESEVGDGNVGEPAFCKWRKFKYGSFTRHPHQTVTETCTNRPGAAYVFVETNAPVGKPVRASFSWLRLLRAASLFFFFSRAAPALCDVLCMYTTKCS